MCSTEKIVFKLFPKSSHGRKHLELKPEGQSSNPLSAAKLIKGVTA